MSIWSVCDRERSLAPLAVGCYDILNMALSEELRSSWTTLRFEFYVAARALWFNGCHSIGAMNFGYAAETSLKHLLAEREGTRVTKETWKHNIENLVKQCRELGALDNYLSDDVVHYLDDRLNFRYPSQRIATANEARQRDHGIGQSLTDIVALDDAILHLDDAIVRLTEDYRTSVMLRGFMQLDGQEGQIFIHSNDGVVFRHVPARRYLSEHRSQLKTELQRTNPHLVDINDKRVEGFQRALEDMSRIGPPRTYLPVSVSASGPGAASSFRYPCKVIRDDEGNVTGVTVSSAPNEVIKLS